jgi:predicted nucleic acid-binding protein
MSAKLQFLDTNILVYAYSEDDPQKREVARSLISSREVMMSTQVLQEFANISHKKIKVNWEEIQATIEELSSKIPHLHKAQNRCRNTSDKFPKL